MRSNATTGGLPRPGHVAGSRIVTIGLPRLHREAGHLPSSGVTCRQRRTQQSGKVGRLPEVARGAGTLYPSLPGVDTPFPPLAIAMDAAGAERVKWQAPTLQPTPGIG